MEKIKQSFWEAILSEKGRDILTVIIVILVGLGSFGLGRLSKSNTSSGIQIEYLGQEASAIQATQYSNVLQKTAITDTPASSSSSGKNFFASSRGSKYYPVGCQAGNNLKQENRIYFATREEAEKSGYELSSSCR
jgi:hypothetical protein